MRIGVVGEQPRSHLREVESFGVGRFPGVEVIVRDGLTGGGQQPGGVVWRLEDRQTHQPATPLVLQGVNPDQSRLAIDGSSEPVHGVDQSGAMLLVRCMD